MRTYKEVFDGLNRAALIPFFVIGDPDFDTSLAIVKTAIDSGADILELGVAFSDPIADGPTIQKADIRACNAGITVEKALEFIRQVKNYKDIPIGLLMYYNLIYQYGREKFFKDFHDAGVNSVLVADLSIDDADEVTAPATSAGLDTVFMVTPNTTDERISVLGVTGSRQELSISVEGLVDKLKKVTDVPVCVGFGISKPEHAVAVAAAGADGVIVGSKLVGLIEENLGKPDTMLEEIGNCLRAISSALQESGT